MTKYYDPWRTTIHTCGKCGWQGAGSEGRQGDMFDALYEIDCPTCGETIDVIEFPTIDESLANWDQVGEADRAVIRCRQALQARFEREGLKDPGQLPELAGEALVLTWDFQVTGKLHETVIRYGEREIWREPAFYEGYERYIAVASILRRRYGDRLQDLVPTRMSFLDLYGDRLGAPDRVDEVRDALAWGRPLPGVQ